MRRPLALALSLLALPAAAQDPASLPDPVALLKGDTLAARLDGAILACLRGTDTPEAALVAYEAAGWERSDEFEGTIGFNGDGVWTMFWAAPESGFCMLETDGMGTAALRGRLAGVLEQAGWAAVETIEIEGCPGIGLGNGITVAPTSGGQDPVCDADDNAALRFQSATN